MIEECDVRLGCGIPLDDEDHICDGSVSHSTGQRSDDCRIIDGNGISGCVARAGHIAAGNRSGDKRLGVRVGSVGRTLSTAADADGKAELVGIDFFTGKSALVAKRGKRQ